MACKEREIQSLQERVIELERQLAEAQAVIQALTPLRGDTLQPTAAPQTEPQEQPEAAFENLIISEAGVRRAIYMIPYPLMIRRDDGQVVMINAAWTKITGYTLENIPTIDEWTRKAYGPEAPQTKSLILDQGFSQDAIKQWGEFEVTTRSGEKRIWDFSTAPLGIDEQGRRLVMSMAVDITKRNQVEEELRAARDEAAWLARFPAENPNPVIRISAEGIVLYCNPPAASLRGWRCAVGAVLSRPLLDLVELAVERDQSIDQDVSLGDKFYSVSVIPILEQGYFNLYGKDITERKQAEKAWEESERRQREITRLLELDQARLAAILKYLPVGVWIVDEQGRLTGSNPEADRIWAGEVRLDSAADYQKYVSWHPGSGELLKTEEYPITVALRTGEPVEPIETNIRRFDGSEGTVLASAVPIKDGRGRLMGVVAVNVDITERKRAEEHIAYQARLLGTVNDAIVGSDAEFRLTAWNAAAESMYGWKAEEILGRNGVEILQTQWPQEDANEMRRMIAESGRWRGEATQLRRDGTRMPVEVSSMVLRNERGQVTGYVSVNRDITERKQTEEALQASEAKMRAVFQALTEGVVFLNQNGEVEEANDAVLDSYGHTVQELADPKLDPRSKIIRPDGTLFPVEEQPAILALRTGEIVRDVEMGVPTSDGNISWRLVNAQPVYDDHGSLLGAVASFFDITERKQAEARINDLLALNEKILNHSSVGILTYQVSGQCVFANEKIASIMGTSVDELLTQNFHMIAAWKKSGLYDLVQQAISTQAPATADLHHVSTFGKDVWVTVHCIKFQSKGEDHVLLSISDITERKQAEQALRESEARYRGLLESQLDLIVRVDPQGSFTFVNDAYCQKFGLKREEILGRESYKPLVHPEDLPHTLEAMKSLYQPPYRAMMEQRAFTVEGVRWIEWQDSAIIDETGKVVEIQAIGRDITDRKQVEAALRESEQRLKRAQEIAHLGSWELDLINNRLTWSDEVYRIFGLQPQQFGATYEAFLEAVHPEDRAAVDNAYTSSIREGRDAYEIEHRVVKYSTGEVRIVHEKCEHFRNQDGQIIRSVGMVHDITDRKQAEEALRESEERFRSLADSMPQLVWTALPNGTVDYYNQRYQEYKEIKQVKDTAWEWAPVLHPDDRQPTLEAWQCSVETGEIYQIEHRVQMVDGSCRWHLSRGVPVRDESGQVIRWFGTATDIHDLKQAEEQLKVYANRLEQSNRELEEFAFMASHDLQEPLRKIEMFGDMLLERAARLNERERNYIDHMRNASGRMRDMVEGLLQLSRITTQGKPFVQVDLSQVVSEVLHDLESQIRRTNGKVNVETLPRIEGDALQLRQLMQNLIGNALKYHQPETPPEVNVSAEQLSGRVQILVKDKGIGFAQENAERIFQPFQRLVGRTQYEGSGMGLAICRRIVERHGGKISAISQHRHGATFIITLPIHNLQKSRIE